MPILSLALTVYEIVRRRSETLTPWTMLFTHIIKLTCAFGMLGLDIFVYIQKHDGHYSLIGLALDGAFM